MTMITPSYLGETIEYSSLHACRSTLEDPTSGSQIRCVCDFEMAPGSPMSDSEMQAFMARGTRAAMQGAAQAAEAAAQRATGLPAAGEASK